MPFKPPIQHRSLCRQIVFTLPLHGNDVVNLQKHRLRFATAGTFAAICFQDLKPDVLISEAGEHPTAKTMGMPAMNRRLTLLTETRLTMRLTSLFRILAKFFKVLNAVFSAGNNRIFTVGTKTLLCPAFT
jgi:hypothetical protein